MKKHVLYVYGTLRPGTTQLHKIPGRMVALGWYPGIKLLAPDAGEFIVAERIEVDEQKLYRLDNYEGYRQHDEENSLYIRRPYLDGWIYEYNHDIEGRTPVPDGDWLRHTAKDKGASSELVETKIEGVTAVFEDDLAESEDAA